MEPRAPLGTKSCSSHVALWVSLSWVLGCSASSGTAAATAEAGGTTAHTSGGTWALTSTSTGGNTFTPVGTIALGGSSTASGSTTKVETQPTGGNASTGGNMAQGASASSAGGKSSNLGGVSSTAGKSATGGASTTTMGGKSATGGASTTTTGGKSATGGQATAGGTQAAGGTSATGGDTNSGDCDSGTTTTQWATNCPAAAPATCTAGTWVAGGPDSSHSGYSKCSESTHFAVYSDEACTNSATKAVEHLETVWNLYFGNPMYMKEPLCNSATKYKVAVHVHSNDGLTGGAWDSLHMGMWIGTNGLLDHWGLAHEFMHGVQSVAGGMTCNQSNTCGWVYESHANWAAQQQDEYHTKDVHCSELLANSSHLYLGSTRDRYCNWQFMEYLKDKYCYSAVNAIWTGKPVNDPFTAILNGQGWNIGQLNDFIGEWAMHNVTWDYQDPAPESSAGSNQGKVFRSSYGLVTDTSKSERRLRLVKMEPLELTSRRFVVPKLHAPQRFGYNIVRLYPESGASSVTVTFRGVIQSGANSDFRWGLVATDSGITQPRYSKLQSGTDGSLRFCVNGSEPLFLVVTATPSVQQQLVWDQLYPSIYRYPYMIELQSAWPEGYQQGTQAACPSGTVRVSNGGGCGPASLPATVYVGPYAQVLGGTVSGSARIDDHAQVLGGKVSGGTVSGLSIVTSNMTISGGTESVAWAYGPGWFESPQSLSGTAQLLGDIEYRGPNLTESSGAYCGFVDNTIASNCSGADVTIAPPYTWRP